MWRRRRRCRRPTWAGDRGTRPPRWARAGRCRTTRTRRRRPCRGRRRRGPGSWPGNGARTARRGRADRCPTARPRRSRPGGPPRPLPRAPVDARARLEELLSLGDGFLVRPEPHVRVPEPERLAVTELARAPDGANGAFDRERRLGCDRVRRPCGALVQLLHGHDLGHEADLVGAAGREPLVVAEE